MEKREIEVSLDKCQSCAYLLPKEYFCERYLRGAETAVYLCPFCRVNEKEIRLEDVVPVRHGRNISNSGFLCSECHFGDFGGFYGYKPNYCPNCGAKMDGEV